MQGGTRDFSGCNREEVEYRRTRGLVGYPVEQLLLRLLSYYEARTAYRVEGIPWLPSSCRPVVLRTEVLR